MKPPPDRLPDPDADARAHSAAVLSAVRAAISGHGGWITFAQYMQSVLYAPALGYYVAGARKFGAAGDFVTAPELTRLFGIACARQVGEVLAATGSREIVELGAGSGRLAADLMAGLAAHHQLPQRYVIVEISPELRERQRATLAAAPMAADLVEWRNDLPDAIDGAIVMNEVLDAIPAH
ncbi:MAG TPA: SAM-dependent methyltransferase, partial [Casimicrobiaceae bacterium]|nr:SAM-dependent methyltransferase [Casimicrobiaceae bacterium]